MTPEYDPVRTEDSEDDARSLSCDVDDECMGTEMRAFFPDSSHLPDAMLAATSPDGAEPRGDAVHRPRERQV